MMGEIVKIWIKRARRGVMDSVERAEAIAGRGLIGNADQGRRRQITIIDEVAWREAAAETGHDVDPSKRRANVMLRGFPLAMVSKDRRAVDPAATGETRQLPSRTVSGSGSNS